MKLIFNEESHTYVLEDEFFVKELTPVSTAIKKFYQPFDEEKWSKIKAKHAGVTQQEMKDQWKKVSKDACDNGTNVHSFGEWYCEKHFGKKLTDEQEQYLIDNKEHPQCKGIVNFWNTIDKDMYDLGGSEQRMWYKDYGGTFDFKLYNKKNKWTEIGDYKTNKDLFKNYKGQTMLAPFSFLLDTAYSKYIIQQNFYKLMIEKEKKEKVGHMFLVHLHEDYVGSNHRVFPLPDFSKILDKHI